jgi:hypothetical protein
MPAAETPSHETFPPPIPASDSGRCRDASHVADRKGANPSDALSGMIVPFPASTDVLARLMGQRLSVRLAQPFLVENRPVVRAPPTLLLATTTNVVNATVYDSFNFNFNFTRETVPVADSDNSGRRSSAPFACGPVQMQRRLSFPANS